MLPVIGCLGGLRIRGEALMICDVDQPSLSTVFFKASKSGNRKTVSHPGPGSDLVWKKRLDLVIALVLLILTSPVILAAVILTKLTSRVPAFYSQPRMGLNGVP